jgi:hypothetical protein
MKTIKITLLIVLNIFMYSSAYTQSTETIQLFDQLTKTPISEVSFQYDDQTGVSDIHGIIALGYKEGAELKLSHVSYGQWLLDDDDVKQAIENRKIYKKPSIINFQPVAVVALHSANKTKKIDLNYHDKLNHDAGAVLNSDPSINSIKKVLRMASILFLGVTRQNS